MKHAQTVPLESSGLVFSHLLDLDVAEELAVMLAALSHLFEKCSSLSNIALSEK